MVRISGGALYQWDTGRYVTVTDITADHVHFSNKGDSKAVIMEIADSQSKIPDYLLQTGKQLCVYVVSNGVTVESKIFSVTYRERPENYVYEEDQRNYIYELISDAEEAVANANLAAQNANEAADKAIQAAKSWVMVGEVSGENILLDDAIEQSFAGFRIFGKTTQDGTPTPDAPVELASVGDSGNITVNVTGENNAQSMTIATPNGLPGIPVSSGGNYTDANGQQWICDEKDFGGGVYVQRVYRKKIANTDGMKRLQSDFGYRFAYATPLLVPSNTTNGAYSLCDSLALVRLGETFSIPNSYTVNGSEIMIALTGSETLDELADYLAEKPIEVQCVLVEPIQTPLSEDELTAYATLHTYRGNTTISNDATARMKIEYVMDAKKYIDSLVGSGTIHQATVE